MKAVIDTSSLLSLVRYYLPFDKEGKLKAFLEERIKAKSLIVLDQVVVECKLIGKGQVIKALPFIDMPKNKVVIVTEETGYSNDGKPFKKIPGICETIGVRTLSLPTFLSENNIIDLAVEVQKTSLF